MNENDFAKAFGYQDVASIDPSIGQRAQITHVIDVLLSRIVEQAEDGDAELLSDLTDAFCNLAQALTLLDIGSSS